MCIPSEFDVDNKLIYIACVEVTPRRNICNNVNFKFPRNFSLIRYLNKVIRERERERDLS